MSFYFSFTGQQQDTALYTYYVLRQNSCTSIFTNHKASRLLLL
jgi:hypothetical protein